MLSKFSVKKPYTVLVAVAIVIVLGALSFQNMSTDFLPDMEFPYAIVMTTYAGNIILFPNNRRKGVIYVRNRSQSGRSRTGCYRTD